MKISWKSIRGKIALALTFALTATLGVLPTTADAADNYTVYASGSYWSVKKEGSTSSTTDSYVYCLDHNAGQPDSSGVGPYTLTQDPGNAALGAAAGSENTSYNDAQRGEMISKLLYFGYPMLGDDAWVSLLESEGLTYDDGRLHDATQQAIWHVTNGDTFSSGSLAAKLIQVADSNDPGGDATLNLYQTEVTSSTGSSYQSFANMTEPSAVGATLQVQKKWVNDLGGTTFTRPKPAVTLQLYKDSVAADNLVSTQTLTGDTASFSVDEPGTYIIHEVLSTNVVGNYFFTAAPDLTITVSDLSMDYPLYEMTNRVTRKVSETIRKDWTEDIPEGATATFSIEKRLAGSAPGTETPVLDSSGNPVTVTVDGTETTPWTAVFENLPASENGTSIVYQVYESDITDKNGNSIFQYYDQTYGYDSAAGVRTCTNKIKQITLNVMKQWPDCWIDGVSVTLKLQQSIDGGQNWTDVKDSGGNVRTITLDGTENMQWMGKFEGLPVFDGEHAISYRAIETAAAYNGEDATELYTPTYYWQSNTYYVSNHYTNPARADFTKQWVGDHDGVTATFKLQWSRDSGTTWTDVLGRDWQPLTVTLDGTETTPWTGSFQDLPPELSGNDVQYRIVETAVTKNGTDVSGDYIASDPVLKDGVWTFTNTNRNAKVQLTVDKKWDSTVPAALQGSVTFGVYNGQGTDAVATFTLTGTAGAVQTDPATGIRFQETSAYSGTVSNLPACDSTAGTIYEYSVGELAVTVDQNGTATDITDRFQTPVVTHDGSAWTITNARKTPAEVTVTATKTMDGRTPDASYTGEFGFSLYLLRTYTAAELAGMDEAARQQEILDAAQGSLPAPYDTAVNASDGTVTFDTLSLDSEGMYVYLLKENGEPVDGVLSDDTVYCLQIEVTQNSAGTGYTADCRTGRITADGIVTAAAPAFDNKGLTSVSVTKKWTGGATGDRAVIVLTANGEKTDRQLVLSTGTGWDGTFEDLRKYDDNGNLIRYGVTEITDSYQVTVTQNADGSFTVTNAPKPAVPTNPTNPTVPATGDSTNVLPLVLLLLGSSAGLFTAAVLRRRRTGT